MGSNNQRKKYVKLDRSDEIDETGSDEMLPLLNEENSDLEDDIDD